VAKRRSSELAQPPLSGPQFRRLMDRSLTEAQWQKQVEKALDTFGWWWMHVPSNVVLCPTCKRRIYRGIRKGVPDIWAIRPPYMLYLELKTERGWLDPEQQRVQDLLRACGQVALCVRPRDRATLLDLLAHPETMKS
jgi:hypothetical protein